MRCRGRGRDLGELVSRPRDTARTPTPAQGNLRRRMGMVAGRTASQRDPQPALSRRSVRAERAAPASDRYLHGMVRAAQGQGVRFHEHSRVRRVERDGARWRVKTAHGEVKAQTVVLACGGYLARLEREVDRAILPIATYVMTTEPLGARMQECLHTEAAIYDTRFAFDYYRPLKDTRLLWGGRISIRNRSAEAVKKLLMRDLLRVFPQLEGVKIDYAWSGLMSYARHQMPQLGTRGDGLWWMQAFGGHGTAPTCAAGELLASAIAQNDQGWREFGQFGLQNTFRPFGFLGAQASYWWLQGRDRFKEVLEG